LDLLESFKKKNRKEEEKKYKSVTNEKYNKLLAEHRIMAKRYIDNGMPTMKANLLARYHFIYFVCSYTMFLIDDNGGGEASFLDVPSQDNAVSDADGEIKASAF
jgi:hypothetical protein